jgi:hypothetical protein
MTTERMPRPRSYAGVMVSSTFIDLKNHREALIDAINGQELKAIAMENDSAKPAEDVIESSLQMVRDSAGYIGVISHKYGQIPECPQRNPNNLSLTELEFNEARRLERPTLIFIMGDEHDVKPADVEKDPEKTKKLEAFRESAKRFREGSSVHRVYKIFNNLHEFEVSATQSIAALRRVLEKQHGEFPPVNASRTVAVGPSPSLESVTRSPNLYAAPPYIGSHVFVGRAEQLETLSEWASPSDPHPLLLYEAIGGVGKSILTWEWTTKHALGVRGDWAGRFWYSFYEKGATMVEFCRRALAYVTGKPRRRFRDRNTAELTEPLIQQLRNRPWLFVLDGLERILVSYHRFDAAQLPDDQAGTFDIIANRDPCATINPEDEDLLRAFAAVSPSKILITSRLVPRVLLNRSNQPIPGALRERLPGLRPTDAELLIRSCGVTGTSRSIQNYLKSHCDCHPLVIGVLAGLITDYLPDRGNFDKWVTDPMGGGRLSLANLDLVQKRNHILSYALLVLPENGRKLLATLALLSESVDYDTLSALNPDLPSLEEVPEPRVPEWQKLSAEERNNAREEYQTNRTRYEDYKIALMSHHTEIYTATSKLSETVRDLERRGLLQYDAIAKHYDLHPVVRGYAAGGLKHDEINRYGQRLVDHFSQRPQNPYDQAETLEDFDNARVIVKALLQMGNVEKARDFILANNFLQVLNSKFEAHNEILTIVKPFFSQGWSIMPATLEKKGGATFAKKAAVALRRICAFQESFAISEAAIQLSLRKKLSEQLCSHLVNLSSSAGELNRLALEDRLLRFAEEIALIYDMKQEWVHFLLARFRQLSIIGDFHGAMEIWSRLNKYTLTSDERAIAAHHYVLHLFFQGSLIEEALKEAEDLNRSLESALGMRNLCALRGFWSVEKGDWESARSSLQMAIARAHKANKIDRRSEIQLAIANHHLGKLSNASQLAEDFARETEAWCQRHLAEFWFTIGNHVEARKHAIAAYHWAWADGEPFVRRSELNKTRRLITQLGEEPPVLKAHDSAMMAKVDWEDALTHAIQKLRIKSEADKAAKEPRARSTP